MRRILCVALLLCVSLIARAEWEYVVGPGGGTPSLLLVSQTKCYAYAYGYGIFHSSNGGLTWDTTNSALRDNQIHAIATHGNVLYAGADSGIFVSTNDGTTWIFRPAYQSSAVMSIVFIRDTLYAETDAGVFRSHDQATTWEPANDGAPSGGFRVVGDSLFLLDDAGALYHFNPNTVEWKPDTVRKWPRVLCVTGDTMYAVGNLRSAIERSVDYGATWDSIGQVSFQTYYIGAAGNLIVLGGKDGTQSPKWTVSSDGGQSWTTTPSSLAFGSYDLLAVIPDGFFMSSNSRLQWSTDGASWTPRCTGLAGLAVMSFSASADTLYASHNRGCDRSTDDGRTWQALPDVPVNNDVGKVFAVDSLLFISAEGLWRLGPSDTTWIRYTKDFSPLGFAAFDGRYFVNDNVSGIARSTDQGVSWVSVNTGLLPLGGTVCLVATDSVLIASNGSLYTTTTHGSLWMPVAVTGQNRVFISTMLSVHDTVYAWDTQLGILRSVTHGRTWTVCLTTLPWAGAPLVPTSRGLLHAVHDAGIYLSTDGAAHWSLVGATDIDTTCTHLIEHDGYLFASTPRRGVWRKAISEIRTAVDEQENALVPCALALKQSYPNPCGASSTIVYTLPTDANISLEIVDALGNVVRNIYSGTESAGEHMAIVDARTLPCGMYHCRLASRGAVRTITLGVMR